MSQADVDSSIRVVDSHTGGEPTRVIVEGAPDLGAGDMCRRRSLLSERYDWLRTALVNEPRGSEWMVGAFLQRPVSADAAAGVIFFNNVGYLGMCGHGLIGVIETLKYLGKIAAGSHEIETPVGVVAAKLEQSGAVTIENVRSYRSRRSATVTVPGFGEIVGDVAWGGNWFFLAESPLPVHTALIDELTDLCKRVLRALGDQGITGDDGAAIDHVELFGPPSDPAAADSINFVLCPGGQHDRSPCGTGTSAKLACLAADGKLPPGQQWRQESVIGSVFCATYRRADGRDGVIPQITGKAFVNGDLRLIIDPRDPFRHGIPQGPARDV